MIGFSAGGIVTSETLFGPAETRPDFAAIIYGAGEIKEVPKPAPPLFLAVAADDTMAVGRTIDLFTAYQKGKGPAELHVFQMECTASSRREAAPITSWTASKSGSRSTRCCRSRRTESGRNTGPSTGVAPFRGGSRWEPANIGRAELELAPRQGASSIRRQWLSHKSIRPLSVSEGIVREG